MWSPLVCSILGFSLMPAHAAGSNPESQRIQKERPPNVYFLLTQPAPQARKFHNLSFVLYFMCPLILSISPQGLGTN